ncbi:hypothetical protein OPQ81_004856 [Rhizoctonia solani]|nr:hypothetical protein OPQ81_004856 [Rhizoctonia solani]
MRPLLQRQTTDQILEYYYEDQPIPRAHRPSRDCANRRLHLVELDMDPDLARRFQPRVALVAPDASPRKSDDPVRPPRTAPPPRPPRLSSPPPKGSPSTSFRSLATASESAGRLVPGQMTRGNSDYSIVAVSDSSTERVTPEPGSHMREGAQQSPLVDGYASDDRGYFSPLDCVDEDDPDGYSPPTRSGTITSRSTRTHTTTPSVTSVYTSSQSHYTQSSKSNYTTQSRDASEEILDLIATVGSELSDMGLDPGAPPTSSALPPSDQDKPPPAAKSPSHSPHASLTHHDTIREFRPSPRTSLADFSRAPSARNSPKPSVSELARASPKPSVSEFPREYGESSPEKRRLRDLSPEKPRMVARDASPEKPRPRQVSPGSGNSKSRVEQVLSDSARSASPHTRTGSGSRSPVARTLNESPTIRYDSSRKSSEKQFSPPRSRSPDKPRQTNPPVVAPSLYEQHSDLGSPRSVHSPRSPRNPTSPRSIQHTTEFKFRQPGSALPESFYFADVLRMKTSSERAQGYIRKINQLAAEDSGLGYWVAFMKGQIKPSPDGQPPPSSVPASPNAQLTTFGPHGPGTRRQQPRHVSGGSVGSEVTFAVRPDAYVATNISIRSSSPPLAGPPPALPYPSLAKDIGLRSVESRPAGPTPAVRAKVGSIGLFSHIGRKSSVKRERDRVVMAQARKPHVLRTGSSGPSYAELPSAKPISLNAPPTIPGGPRARPDKRGMDDTASDSGHSHTHTLQPHPRSSVIMIGGRDSFQTMSPSGDGRPVSIRVPSSNGHGVVTPNIPPISSPNSNTFSSGMRSPEPPSSYREREGSVYSRESYRAGSRASSALGHGNGPGGGNIEQLVDVLPHVDRGVLQGYLDRAGGHEIDAISAYLEDERRMNGSVGHEYG